MMGSSADLFDTLAARYDEHFDVLHRRYYDQLAWERVRMLLPERPGLVVDAGCGTGRWVPRLLELGHDVVGIEQAGAMADQASQLQDDGRFVLHRASMEEIDLPKGSVDVVIAMGSLQYTRDPFGTIGRFAGWLRPGGAVCVLVDSLLALVVELFRRGQEEEAFHRLSTRMGTFRVGDVGAEHHLLDRAWLTQTFASAGLVDVEVQGLLVSASMFGLEELSAKLREDPERQLGDERRLAAEPSLADLGKQLLTWGRRPP
jgi:SAM-dependent methyltransferase